jgi:hypothetical protein
MFADFFEVEIINADRVSTIYPAHGSGGDVTPITQTRSYCTISPTQLRAGMRRRLSSGFWPNTRTTMKAVSDRVQHARLLSVRPIDLGQL